MIRRRFLLQHLLGSAASAGAFFLASPASAQVVWQGSVDANWGNPDNWLPTGVPGPGAEVVFGETGAGTVAFSGGIEVTSISINSLANYNFTGSATNFVGGATTITKNGTGTATLGGTNTFTGGTLISGGILQPSGNQALGAVGSQITIASGGTFNVNGAMTANRNYHARISGTGAGNGAIVNSGAENQQAFGRLSLDADASIGGTGRWDVRGLGGNGSFSGLLDLGGHTLTKTGTNKIAIIDAVATADGSINIDAGTLGFTRSNVSGSGSINVNSGGTLQLENYSTGTFTKAIALNDGATLQSQGNAISIGSNITLSGSSTINTAIALTVAGSIEGTGSLTKIGGSNLIIAGDATHTGGTTVTTGTLQIGNGGTTGSISGNITNNSTVNFNRSGDLVYGGEISGTGNLTKAGAGIVVLTGTNTFSGNTTISGGGIVIASTDSLPGWNTNGRYSVAANTILGVRNTVTDADVTTMLATTNFAAGSLVGYDTTAGDRTLGNSIGNTAQGALGLAKLGPNVLTLTAASSYTGNTNVSGGILRLESGNNRLPTGTVVNTANVAGAALDLNGLDQEIRSLTGGGTSGGNVMNGGASPSILTIRPADSDNSTFSGQISGDVRLEIVGTKASPSFAAPRQRLAGTANTFTGGILIDGATLMARLDGSLGAVPAEFQADNITLRNNGTLFNEGGEVLSVHANRGITLGAGGGAFSAGFSTNVIIGSVISGDAGNSLTILGNNATMIFTGDNTYAGQTVLNGATALLQIGNGGTSGTLGTGDVNNNGGVLTFNRSGSVGYDGVISGTGSLVKTGDGTLTLGGSNTYTGATTVTAGTLLVNGALGNTSVSIADGATLGGNNGTIGGTVTTAAAGAIIAPGNSTGTITFGGLNVVSGATFEFELGGAISDQIVIAGALAAGGPLTFNFSDAGDIATATAYTLFSYGSQTGLEYGQLTAATLPSGLTLDESFGTGGWLIDDTAGVLQVQFIPEPSSAFLAALGLFLSFRRRR